MDRFVPRQALKRVAALVALSAMASCSLIYDTSEVQCDTDADCSLRGFDGSRCVDNVCQADEPSEWSCIGEVQWPAIGSVPVTLRLMVIDVLTSAPPQDLEVDLCPKLDVDCVNPSPASAKTTADGFLEVTVNAGFDGYLQLKSPTITTSLFFPTRPVFEDTVIPGMMPVVSPEGFDGIAQAIGTVRDPAMGHTFAMAANCDEQPAAGVRFEVSDQNAKTARYYMVNNAPVATENATDAAGNGGFLNLDPGFARITGFVAESGATVGEASFVVRAGAVTYPRIIPTPQ